ncbi:MAG: polyprenyl synthetase family protein [Halieaceae bacterium]|jgi:octaprenyl-diphosphate synthase|nr:polyprenyl synthetase family protein [Halieaceae bacterium]
MLAPSNTPESPIQAIRAPVLDDVEAVNALIVANLASDVGLVENIGHYIVEAGGKRLRPLLALLAARCCGYQGEDHIRFAAVVEFIHTATLLHDDVVDLSALRRGRPTANAEFGNAPSVLVGDFLYSRAFQLMVAIGNMDIMRDMANTTNEIAAGEVLQLVRAGDPSTGEDDYMDVIRRKTAILFASACYGAGALCERFQETAAPLARFGSDVGIAFQIIDDVLDYEGDPAVMGKNVGDDLNEGKPTLPLIHVLRNGNSAERELVTRAIRDKNASEIDAVLAAVRRNGSLDYARSLATSYQSSALAALEKLPDNTCRDAMAAIAHLALARDH